MMFLHPIFMVIVVLGTFFHLPTFLSTILDDEKQRIYFVWPNGASSNLYVIMTCNANREPGIGRYKTQETLSAKSLPVTN